MLFTHDLWMNMLLHMLIRTYDHTYIYSYIHILIHTGAPKLDSGALFAMIFGSEKFEPLVGELKLTTQINENQNQEGQHYEPKELTKFRQRKRVLQCAINLAKKLGRSILLLS